MTRICHAVSYQRLKLCPEPIGVPCPQSTEEEIEVDSTNQGSVPVAMRATELTESDVEVLRRIAQDPQAKAGRIPANRVFRKIQNRDQRNGR
jgi:hypothetical protein